MFIIVSEVEPKSAEETLVDKSTVSNNDNMASNENAKGKIVSRNLSI